MVLLGRMAHPPTLERQWVIRVKPERAWRWALAWERVRSELGLVSEQTTELRFRVVSLFGVDSLWGDNG